MSIIFQSTLRRLGICCDLVDSDLGLLCWKPKSAENPKKKEIFYIDLLHGGTIKDRSNCSITNLNNHKELNPVQILFILEMQRYYFTSLESNALVSENLDNDFKYLDTMEDLYRNNFNNKNISYLLFSDQTLLKAHHERFVETVDEMNENKLIRFERILIHMNRQIYKYFGALKRRTDNIKFSVGTFVICTKADIIDTSIIIGWDEYYNPTSMNNHNYISICDPETYDTFNQPFYFILCNDGNTYYVSQGTLINTDPKWIEHDDIGKYFTRDKDFMFELLVEYDRASLS